MQVWVLAALLAGLAAALAVWYSVLQRQAIEREALSRVGLYARVAEDQASRALDAAAHVLRSLAARGTVRRVETDAAAAQRLLEQQLAGQPYLRSLSVLDSHGRVLASTHDEDVGRQVDLAALGSRALDARGLALGPLLQARQLADLGAASSGGTTALPLLHRASMEDGEPGYLLVALVNPDYFATQQSLVTSGSAVHLLIADLQGRVLTTSRDGDSGNARDIAALPPFVDFLPQRELGEYLGAGSDGGGAVAAFRISRRWPLLILAEQSQQTIHAQWAPRAGGAAAIAVGIWLLLGALGWSIDRSLRRERAASERTQRLLDELAVTEQRWKLALEGAGQVVWDMDLHSGELVVSARIGILLGLDSDDRHWDVARLREVTHPDDLERTTQAIERHLRGESDHYEDELRLRMRNGQWKWVHSRATVVQGSGIPGARPRLIGTLTDIDVRKAAETALRESEARQQAILRSALDGIVIIDKDGQVVQFNPAAEAMFGRRQADVAGLPMHELIVPPQHRLAHQQGMQRFRATGQGPLLNRRIEVEAMRSDGTLFPVELTIVPVTNEDSTIFTATVRDITERLSVEAALRDSEVRARATFDQAAVGVLQQGADRRFLRVNQTLCDLLGYTPQEFLALAADDLVHADDVASGLQGMRGLFAGETASFAQEKRYRRKDGRYVWVRLTASIARDGQGQPLYMIGIVEDIDARRQAQDELQAARERELQIGTRIQKSLLVAEAPSDTPGLWLSSYSQASQGIDGDFVELIQLDEGVLDIVAGDVMGKGVNAALMGAAVKMQFSRSLVGLMTPSARGEALPQPAEILRAVDRAMTPHLQALEAFVTLCYLRIDLRAGRLTWVGCGHEEALLRRQDGRLEVLHNQQPPLGVLGDTEFLQQHLATQPGDALLLHSDGVSDALCPDGQRVGSDWVRERFGRHAREHATPAAALHLLRGDLQQRAEVRDDLTLLVVRFGPVDAQTRRLELAPNVAAIPKLRRWFEQAAAATRLQEAEAGLFCVAAVEVFTNIVRHATGGVADAPVEVLCRPANDGMELEFVYPGDAYLPEEVHDTRFDEYPEGGFGLAIIQRACDEVEYRHHAGVNHTRLLRLASPN